MITIWHNPRCSKSRQALALLQDAGVEISERRYLDDAPSLEELTKAQQALGLAAIDMMRTKEAVFKELNLSKDMPDTDLLSAMAAHPKLIERPVVFNGDKAIIARPPERISEVL